jgi:hypothetical protein
MYLNTPLFHRPGWIERCIECGVHFEGWSILRRVDEEEMPPLLKRMHKEAPELFNFSPAPPERARRAFCGYAWLRRSGRLPGRVVDWCDAHPDAVTEGAPSFAFRGIDAARRARRRVWDRPEPPSFLPLESALRARRTLRKHPEWTNPNHLSLGDLVASGR